MLRTGYNFDGVQTPMVIRKDDPVVANPVLSVPNFYGAHGFDPNILNMSAIFFAAGPDIGRGTLRQIQTVDIAPTILKLLGVEAPSTADGKALAVRLPKNLLTTLRDQLNALGGGDPETHLRNAIDALIARSTTMRGRMVHTCATTAAWCSHWSRPPRVSCSKSTTLLR